MRSWAAALRIDRRGHARTRGRSRDPDRSASGIIRPDFRVEKLSGHQQIERFRKTGLWKRYSGPPPTTAEIVPARVLLVRKAQATVPGICIRRPPRQRHLRAEIPPCHGDEIMPSGHRVQDQPGAAELTLSNGEEVSAACRAGQWTERRSLRQTLASNAGSSSACHSF